MKKYWSFSIFSILSILFFFACNQTDKNIGALQSSESYPSTEGKATFVGNKEFDEYWYGGEAELSSYDLQQARYGEIHPGEAVLVFVTEPFSQSKQVKLDNPEANPKDAVSVMKLNFSKKFYTGIYPYSIMQSSFTPIDLKSFPNSLKVSTSSQEWCGHTFTQLNLTKDAFRIQEHSYFESEGDTDRKINRALLEDEVWSRIRINPASLPTGEIDLIPGTVYSRLRHTPLKVEKATATMSPSAENPEWLVYNIHYPSMNRDLKISFSKQFPHIIQGWEDTYLSGFGAGAQTLSTKAKLKKTIKLDYWSHHNLADAKYRELLELK